MSTQQSLNFTGTRRKFDGSDYVPALDDVRLTGQILRVFECMKDGQWRTLSEISLDSAFASGKRDGEASISAQLRNLKKAKWGAHTIERRARGDRERGLFEYRIAS
jgi:IS5 family transposase